MATVIRHTGLTGSIVETSDGLTDSIEYTVTGLTNIDPLLAKKEALFAAGIPKLGSKHPGGGIVVIRRQATLIDDSVATIVVSYGVPTHTNTEITRTESAKIDLSSTVQSVQTNIDVNGNMLLLEQEFPPFPAVDTEKYYGSAQVGLAMQVITLSQKEVGSPGNKSRIYTNTINSGSVPWDTGPTQKHSWRCNGISGSRLAVIDDIWDVRYAFQFAEPKTVDGVTFGGWDAFLVMLKDGEIRDGLVMGAGKNHFQLYREKDFNSIPGLLPQ